MNIPKRFAGECIVAVIILFIVIVSAAAQDYRDAETGMEFVHVKGGCYKMGDTFGDGEFFEKPAHEVCVNNYYIGKYEVTQGQWQTIMGDNPSHFISCGMNCPVEKVSWNQAKKFIEKLNNKTGKHYRLPSEAEWEYAARSGGKQEMWAGTSDLRKFEEYAWHKDNSSGKTHVVGKKKPNDLGIYDMSGNVWEWVNDRFAWDYYKQSPMYNPQGPSSGNQRVTRGGSWSYEPFLLRVTYRDWAVPSYQFDLSGGGIGFRIVLPSEK